MTTTNGTLVIVNNGDQRASYAVAFSGHLDAEGAVPYISKRSIEVLKQMADIGKDYGVSDKLVKGLGDRLRGFPHGEDVYNYLELNSISLLDYVENASDLLKSVGKGGTGERAKRGQGHVTKANKFLGAVAAKLVCRYAPASETGELTDDMLVAGLEKAIEAFQTIDKAAVVSAARKIAEKTGLDPDGRIRLRSESKDEDGDDE